MTDHQKCLLAFSRVDTLEELGPIVELWSFSGPPCDAPAQAEAQRKAITAAVHRALGKQTPCVEAARCVDAASVEATAASYLQATRLLGLR